MEFVGEVEGLQVSQAQSGYKAFLIGNLMLPRLHTSWCSHAFFCSIEV